MSGEDFTSPVPVSFIEQQRAEGWPNIHPEDFCHRCGDRNMLWFASRNDWLIATSEWAAETGREGICCPRCFAEMHQARTGESTIWELRRYEPEPIRKEATE